MPPHALFVPRPFPCTSRASPYAHPARLLLTRPAWCSRLVLASRYSLESSTLNGLFLGSSSVERPNALSGSIPSQLARLSNLSKWDAAGLRLSGTVPTAMVTKLEEQFQARNAGGGEGEAGFLALLDLSKNALSGRPPESVIKHCLSPAVTCQGLPPNSCSAFGPSMRLKFSDIGKCIACPSYAVVAALVAFVLVAWLAAMALLYKINQLMERQACHLPRSPPGHDLLLPSHAFSHASSFGSPRDLLRPQIVSMQTVFATVSIVIGQVRPSPEISTRPRPSPPFSRLLTPSHAFSHAPNVIGQVQIVGIFSELTASTGSYASVVSGITSAFLLDPTMVDIECLVPPALMDFSAAGSDGLNPQTSAQLGILAVPVVTFVGLLIAQAVCACMGKPTAYDKCARLMLIFFMLQVLDLPSPPPLLNIRRPPS